MFFPAFYDRQAVLAFKDKLLTAIERRTNIALDLMGRDDWDLYLMVYPESHTANHVLWHLGEQHPLHAPDAGLSHALLEIYQAIDDGIRRFDKWPVQQPLLIYTLDHTTRNSMDVPGMVLLPEYLYRWNFPGHRALATGDAGTSLVSLAWITDTLEARCMVPAHRRRRRLAGISRQTGGRR